jgi:urease accessory protein
MSGSLRPLSGYWFSAAAAGLLLFAPVPAAAHLVTTGMGPVYDGIGHLLLTPEDLVPVLGLALYSGLRGAAAGRRVIFLLPLAWFAGGLTGMATIGLSLPFAPVLSFLLIGLLVAADLRLPAQIVAALAVLLGLVHGFLNGPVLKAGPGIAGLLGIMTLLFVLAALVSALVISLRQPWLRIAVRVAGSWMGACGLLMLGWLMQGPV